MATRRVNSTHLKAAAASVLVLIAHAASMQAQPKQLIGTDPQPPRLTGPINPPPRELKLVEATSSSIRMSVICGRNAEEHEVYRRLANSNQWGPIDYQPNCALPESPIVDNRIAAQTSYCYEVRASNSTSTVPSNMLCVNTAPLAPVIWVEASGATQTRVVLRPRSSARSNFEVKARRLGQTDWSVVGNVTTSSLFDEVAIGHALLTPNTTYEYKATAGYQDIRKDSATITITTRPATAPTSPTGCNNDRDRNRCFHTFVASTGMAVTYYSNHPFTAPNPLIRRVVLVIHGKERLPWDAFWYMRQAAAASGVPGETLIVAPYFAWEIWPETWKEGGEASGQMGQRPLSSFGVADELILAMTRSTVFSNVREVVVAGHSAGGQFTNRYAALSTIAERVPGKRFRFVVSNPGSYLYLDDARPGPTGITVRVNNCGDGTIVPSQVPAFSIPGPGCPAYDDYKYGLKYRQGYAAALSPEQIRNQYRARMVTYLLGEEDTDIIAEDTCAQKAQGRNRLFRGIFYFERLVTQYNDIRHRKLIVACTGHSPGAMYDSPQGHAALFFTY